MGSLEVQIVKENNWKNDVLGSGAEGKKWKKRLVQFIVGGNGRRMWGELKLSTLRRVEQVLQLIPHKKERHVKDKRTLRKPL